MRRKDRILGGKWGAGLMVEGGKLAVGSWRLAMVG